MISFPIHRRSPGVRSPHISDIFPRATLFLFSPTISRYPLRLLVDPSTHPSSLSGSRYAPRIRDSRPTGEGLPFPIESAFPSFPTLASYRNFFVPPSTFESCLFPPFPSPQRSYSSSKITSHESNCSPPHARPLTTSLT